MPGSDTIKDDETVVFFPTAASLSADKKTWSIPVHGWIFELEADSRWRKVFIASIPQLLDEDRELADQRFVDERARMFVVDNERGKNIRVSLHAQTHALEPSQPNGHFRGLASTDARLEQTCPPWQWLRYQAVTRPGDARAFEGRAQLVGPEGISVISDIDDTVKVSNVKDEKELLRNTFLRPFRPVPGMVAAYRKWALEGAAFHYVSGSPWQLYPALNAFLDHHGFPSGSFHLKNFRLKDRSFFSLFATQQDHKRPVIEGLLTAYPGRGFVLVGDAGEEDPEIFADLARRYPIQIEHVFIRDSADASTQSERYRQAFAGIQPKRWTIVRDGTELLRFDLPKACG